MISMRLIYRASFLLTITVVLFIFAVGLDFTYFSLFFADEPPKETHSNYVSPLKENTLPKVEMM